YHLDVKAPGFDKADFNINLDGNLLSISVEKKEDQKVENPKFVRREFSFKSFKRSFTLDEKIDAEKIDAKYENGILKLELPKKAVAKPDTRQISIQ
ncbi:MAG: Hsp20/alpha crystallin family protein, partial [Bacteroidetes bacterium]|nr:Hsp20/alpha crystallin family protein [Bacteroidota bacterium]